MKLTPHEQQALDAIARELQDEDPVFAVTLTGEPARHRGVGSAICCGLAAFICGAVLCAAMPVAGVCMGVTGFLILLIAVRFVSHGVPTTHGQASSQHWLQHLWGAFGGLPPGGLG